MMFCRIEVVGSKQETLSPFGEEMEDLQSLREGRRGAGGYQLIRSLVHSCFAKSGVLSLTSVGFDAEILPTVF